MKDRRKGSKDQRITYIHSIGKTGARNFAQPCTHIVSMGLNLDLEVPK